MEKLYKLVQGYYKKFPKGVEPFQMVTRLLEECGEVASEVNLWEDSGIKRQKRGEPRKEDLADEIKQALVALMQIAVYYKNRTPLAAGKLRTAERTLKRGGGYCACHLLERKRKPTA